MPSYLWIVIIFLVGIVALVFVADYFLRPTKKKSPTKSAQPAPKPAPAPETKPAEPVTPVEPKALNIYNSELADDLDAIIREAESQNKTRIQIEERINRQGNIARYVSEKKYHVFDFDDNQDDETGEDANQMTFTKEDYKRVVALSNIHNKK